MVDVWLTTDYSIVIPESEPVSTVVENSTNTDDQHYFEISQLEFDEPYSQEAMESALNYYIREQSTPELPAMASVPYANDSENLTELDDDEVLSEISVSDETVKSEPSPAESGVESISEATSVTTSIDAEPTVSYDPIQEADEEAVSAFVLDLLLSEAPHHDELLNLELNKV